MYECKNKEFKGLCKWVSRAGYCSYASLSDKPAITCDFPCETAKCVARNKSENNDTGC